MRSEPATGPSGPTLKINKELDKTTKLREKEESQETEQDGVGTNKFSISINVGEVSPEEVTVKVKDGILSISGQHVENKGKGFSFHGFTEEYTIPPTVDSRTLVATILDGKTMKIEGFHRLTPTDDNCRLKSTEIVADSKTTQQSRKRSFSISERSSFDSSYDVTTFPSFVSKENCNTFTDCSQDGCCASTICSSNQAFPVHCSTKPHCNMTQQSSDKNTGVPTPSKKRKTTKMPPSSSSRSTTPGVRPKANILTTKSNIKPPTPPPFRTKHSVVSPTPMKKAGEKSFMPNPWSTWAKSDFEPLTPSQTSDIRQSPSPQ